MMGRTSDMSLKSTWALAQRYLVVLTLMISGLFGGANLASATLLPVGNEQEDWSDIVFTGVDLDYDGTTFSASRASGATQIEIGGEFGPSNPGNQYGVGGTLGGLGGGSPVLVSFDLSGVLIDSSGIVTNPAGAGNSVTVTYTSPPVGTFPGDLADDYGIAVGDTLLEGKVLEVLLGATGNDTLDVLFSITGGALQTGTNSESALAGIPFSNQGLGVLRIAAGSPLLPADWSTAFNVTGATMDVLGIPEPSSMGLGMIGAMLALAGRSARRRNKAKR